MATARAATFFRQLDALELGVCLRANRACRLHPVERFFDTVSRLGDGSIWYALIVLLPLTFGADAIEVSVRMAVTGVVGVLVYKLLKSRMVRQRPYVSHAGIFSATPPLDRYSFPSGHTLHAVAFTAIACAHFPILAWALVPFTMLVAASRVILGLHYPSDVLVGAALGGLLAYFGLQI
ncbi:MAG: phosphatase PAP2 family protein [Gammaproteobacteria bacterium]|jgi:undecaprenyl-diphosphatase|nr:phosphatase PAP2 family protein [Gammaproteobacteria bacterium]